MNIGNGDMNFSASIEYKQLVEAVEDIKKRLSKVEKSADDAGKSLDKLGKDFKEMLAAIGGTAAITGFVKKMFEVRSSFQDTQSAMEVFLGSTEKAEEHMKALQQYAWYNMFDFSTLTQASAQLQAFGTNVDDVIPLIDRLSNIAAGTKTSLMDLVETFNRAKSVGTADSRMLMSFATKGLDVVTTLREMGVAVDGTSVSFEQLMMAVEAATNEGGRFYQLMDAQFNNLSSLAGAVEDDISIMLNELGERLQPTMENVLRFTHKLIDNYETVGRVLVGLIATYGTYRAALVAVTTAQKLQAKYTAANTAATKTHYAWTLMMQKAQALLNKTMLLNPYVAIATALVAATAAIVAFTKHKQKERQAIIDSTSDMREEFTQTNMLIDKLKDANKTEEERRKILEDLREVNPGIVDGIKNEADAYAELSERVKDYNKQQLAAMAVKQFTVKEDFQGAVDDMVEAEEKMQSANTKMYNVWAEVYGNYTEAKSRLKKETVDFIESVNASDMPYSEKIQSLINKYIELTKKNRYAYVKDNDEFTLNRIIYSVSGVNDKSYEKASEELDKFTEEYEKKAAAVKKQIEDIANAANFDNAEARKDFIDSQMMVYFPEEKEVVEAGKKTASTVRSVWEDILDENGEEFKDENGKTIKGYKSLVRQIEEARKEYESLLKKKGDDTYDTTTTQKEIEAKKKTLDSLKEQFKSLTNLEYDKVTENELKAQREAQDARLALIEDAFEQERQKTKAKYDNEIADLQRKLGKEANLTEKEKTSINSRIMSLQQQKAKALKAIEYEEIASRKQLQASLDELNAEEKRRTKQYEYEKEQIAIDAMEDGFQKELAQMELNHSKRMDEIEREAKEEEKLYYETAKERYKKENPNSDPNIFDANWTGVPEEDKAAIDQRAQERTDAENNAYFSKKQKLISDLLTQYEDYETKKLKIAKKYADEIASLESEKKKTASIDEQEALAKAISGSKKSQAKATLELEVAKIDTSKYDSVEKKINAINEAYAAYIANLREAGATDEEITEAQRMQLEATDELIQLLAKQAALMTRLEWSKQFNPDDVKDIEKELKGVNAQIAKMTRANPGEAFIQGFRENKMQMILDVTQQLVAAFQQLADASDSVNAKDASGFLSSVSKGLQGFAQGGFIGLLMAGIEDTISQITDAILAAKKLENAISAANLESWKNEMQGVLDTDAGIFGDNEIANVNAAVGVLESAKDKMAELATTTQDLGYRFSDFLAMTHLFNWKTALTLTTGAEYTNAAMKTWEEALEKGYNNIESFILTKNDKGWLVNFFGIEDEFISLKDAAAELGYELYDVYGNLNADALQAMLDTYEDLSGEQRAWLEQGIAYSEQYAEAMESITSYLENLFGGVAGDIADKMIEAFIESGDAAVDLGETVADVGKQMAKDLLKSMILSTYFDGLEEDFKNKIVKDGMNADTAGYIMSTIQSAMTALDGDMEYWNQVIQGLSSMWGDAASDAESVGAGTALASASQESIDLMNGQLNAMRNVQSSIDNKISSILISLSGIDTHIKDGFERSNTHLEKIASNTSEQGSLARAFGFYNN